MCIADIHRTIPSYFDGISAAMNILLCWRDVDDAESPDCNDFAKSFGQLVGPYNLCHNLSANVAYGLAEAREAWIETSQSFREK